MLQKKSMLFLMFTILCIGSFSVSGFSMDIQTLKKLAKDKQEQVQKELKDVKVVQEVIIYGSVNKEIKSEQTIFRKGKKFRTESSGNLFMSALMGKSSVKEAKTIFVNDGTNMWLITSEGKRRLPTGKNMNDSAFWLDNIPNEGTVVKEEIINGRDSFVINSSYDEKGIPSISLCIDKKTFNLVQFNNVSGKSITKFTDFRKILNENEMSFKSETYNDGKLAMKMLVKSYEINKGLPDNLFNVDNIKEAPPINMPVSDPKVMQKYMKIMEEEKNKQGKNISESKEMSPEKAKKMKDFMKNFKNQPSDQE